MPTRRLRLGTLGCALTPGDLHPPPLRVSHRPGPSEAGTWEASPPGREPASAHGGRITHGYAQLSGSVSRKGGGEKAFYKVRAPLPAPRGIAVHSPWSSLFIPQPLGTQKVPQLRFPWQHNSAPPRFLGCHGVIIHGPRVVDLGSS